MIDTTLLLRYRWKFFAGLLAAAAFTLLLVRWWQGPLAPTERVVRRDFVQSVVASGHVETPHRIDIGAQITAAVARVPVVEGQDVQAGDVLIELASAELRATQRQAETAVAQAKARLRQLREVQEPVAEQALRQAQTTLDNARTLQGRNQNLFEKGFISQSTLDDTRKNVELADAQLRSAQKQLDTTRATGSDTALAQAALAEAEASAVAARARTSYATIRAPIAGTLIARNVEAGDTVQPGKILMTLSPLGRTQLIVQIDEKNLRWLALGQSAIASADAYPQQRFAAQVAYINPAINAQTGAVEVKLDVPTLPPELKQDMTVSVDIQVAQRPRALLAPLGAVYNLNGENGAPWVLQVENGRALRREIRVGLQSAGFVEVLAGLREGDAVLPVAARIAPGARVRASSAEQK